MNGKHKEPFKIIVFLTSNLGYNNKNTIIKKNKQKNVEVKKIDIQERYIRLDPWWDHINRKFTISNEYYDYK